MHRLVLMRHAKSAWPEGVSDFDRPLAPRGQMAAPLMARWLASSGMAPPVAWISSARRTRETWAAMAQHLVGTAGSFEPAIYNASASTLLGLLRSAPADRAALWMIGHNPGMQELAHGLADPAQSDKGALARLARKFPTAGIAILESEEPFAVTRPRSMRLVRFLTPAMLGGIDED